jgi:hypothetical protein
MVTKIFPSDNEPPKKKRGGGTFFLTTISLPKKKKGQKIPSQNQSFPQSFPRHFYRGKLHFIGLAKVNPQPRLVTLTLFELGLFAALLLSPKNVGFELRGADLIKPWDICYV